MTSERVDAEGISNIAEAAKQFLPGRNQPPVVETVLTMGSSSDLEAWEKLDDVIMGGKSGSFLQTAETVEGFRGEYKNQARYPYKGAVWRGELVVQGGGFCGARTKVRLASVFTRLQYALCDIVLHAQIMYHWLAGTL